MSIIDNIDTMEMNSMDLTYFHTFREVAHRKSFTRAAEELGYAQSSVTAQIQKLEKAYDTQLFERFGKGVRLTSSGEELLKLTVQMLDLFDESKEKLRTEGGGTISVGTMDSLAAYFLPPLIQQLRKQYEGLSIRLWTDREDLLVQRVKEGDLDIGLILDNEPEDPALHWQTVREEPLVLIAGPGHPLADREIIRLQDLYDAEWILPEETCNYRVMLEKLLKQHGIPCRLGLELGNPEAIKRCVMTGSGISLLPRMAADDEIRRGLLAPLPFSHPDLRLSLQLMTHPKKWISRALGDFIELVRKSP